MAQPHIVFCESNIKGGVRANLGPKTLVVGPSFTGKSAVTNTAELAASGRVSDIQGRRDVGKEIELMQLAPAVGGKRMELFARAIWSDGSEASWRAGGKGKKSAMHAFPPFVDPEAALPLRPVYAAVTGAVETARKFFLQHAVGSISDKDVLDRIPTASHPYFKRAALATSDSAASPVDRLLAALEHAKKETRAADTRALASEAASISNASGLPPLPTEAEEKALAEAVKEAEARLDTLKRRIAQVEALQGAAARRDEVLERHRMARLALVNARTQREEADRALATLVVPVVLDVGVQAVTASIRAHIAEGRTDCLNCGSPGPFDFRERQRRLEGYLESVLASSRAYIGAKKFAEEALLEEKRAEVEFAAAEKAAIEVNALLAQGPQEIPSEARLAEAEAQLVGLRGRQRDQDILRATWGSSQRARDTAREATRDGEEWKKLVTACQDAVLSLLDSGVAGFTARVQRFLPPSFEFGLTLRDGSRGVFQFGRMKEGQLETALSGVEWAAVTSAMAAVCRRPDKYALIVPEERAFSPLVLYEVLSAFAAIDAQVIVTSPIRPGRRLVDGSIVEELPAGWTLVDTERGDTQNGAPPEALFREAEAVGLVAPSIPALFKNG